MIILTGILYLVFAAMLAKCSEDSKFSEEYLDQLCGTKLLSRDVSCHNQTAQNDIHVLDDKTPHFFENSIFFIETSCKGVLNIRQACSIEAAASGHRSRHVIVLFAGPVISECLQTSPMWEILNFYRNVYFYRVHIIDYLTKTPLEHLTRPNALNLGLFPVRHIADILKWTTLYKYGGIYLDLDVIVTKSFDNLQEQKNFIGREDDTDLGSAVLGLTKRGIGGEISRAILQMFKANVATSSLGYNSMELVLKVLKDICNTTDILLMSSATCQGFEVYEPSVFYPIRYQDWKKFFRMARDFPREPFAFHLWDRLSHNEDIYDDSLYAQLMKEHCPKMYELLNFY